MPLAAMVAANFAMVAVMTMTPVHARLHGQSLQMVGVVINAQMLGMFALSPMSGWLADWRGGAISAISDHLQAFALEHTGLGQYRCVVKHARR